MRKFWSCGPHVKSKTNNATDRWCNLLPQNVERTKPYAWNCSAQSGRVHTHSVSWTWEGYLSHRYHWCCMVSIKRLNSQQLVFSQPRFVAVLQKLAMEVHKPSCQLAEKKKTWRPWNASSEKKRQNGKRYMSRWKWAGTVVKRETVQKNGSKILVPKHCRNRRFATAPHSVL